ncbi:MAG: LacI family DNA-binding transcriptional regulator [Anaerolineae bacterium]|nr:LacI family DNA-binding transcriptional regulator [Anaerolineae bacterium]
MPNIKDVAKRAGVSATYVGRTLSGYPHVSPDVRQRVLHAVEELVYRRSRG